MSKLSDIFIQHEFKRKTYKNEITKIIREGSEKAINKEINKINKLMRDRVAKLESKGLDKFSPALKALKNRIGEAGDRPMFQSPSMLLDLDEKIKYLKAMRSCIDNQTMTLGGAREYMTNMRKRIPVLDKIYKEMGEKAAGESFEYIIDLTEKLGKHSPSDDVVTEHQNAIADIASNMSASGDIAEYNRGVNELQNKVLGFLDTEFKKMQNEFLH